MSNSTSRGSFECRKGTVSITDSYIEIDTSVIGAVKIIYKQSKILFYIIMISLLFMATVLVISQDQYRRTLAKFVFSFALLAFAISYAHKILQEKYLNISPEIQLEKVDRVEYTTGSQLSPPKVTIMVTGPKKMRSRPVHLSHQKLGGDKQLENAINVFEDGDITIVPAGETPITEG